MSTPATASTKRVRRSNASSANGPAPKKRAPAKSVCPRDPATGGANAVPSIPIIKTEVEKQAALLLKTRKCNLVKFLFRSLENIGIKKCNIIFEKEDKPENRPGVIKMNALSNVKQLYVFVRLLPEHFELCEQTEPKVIVGVSVPVLHNHFSCLKYGDVLSVHSGMHPLVNTNEVDTLHINIHGRRTQKEYIQKTMNLDIEDIRCNKLEFDVLFKVNVLQLNSVCKEMLKDKVSVVQLRFENNRISFVHVREGANYDPGSKIQIFGSTVRLNEVEHIEDSSDDDGIIDGDPPSDNEGGAGDTNDDALDEDDAHLEASEQYRDREVFNDPKAVLVDNASTPTDFTVGLFNLKTLMLITKSSKYCRRVHLYMAPNHALLVNYPLGLAGNVRYILLPEPSGHEGVAPA